MGLDGVELIMAVEEAFDIEIADAEVEQLHTVGSMYALIVSKLALSQSRRCMSSAVFYQIRRALIGLHDLPRQRIAPSVRMDRLLPAQRRRAHWRDLGFVMRAELPDLQLPGRTRRLLAGLGMALLLSWLAAYRAYPLPIVMLYALGSALLMRAVYRAAAPFAVQLPRECATVGGTVKAIIALNHGSGPPTRKDWNPNDVWEILRHVIVEELDVPPETVTVDADFVRDLGVG